MFKFISQVHLGIFFMLIELNSNLIQLIKLKIERGMYMYI